MRLLEIAAIYYAEDLNRFAGLAVLFVPTADRL
jgi:hypothetical protein